MIHKKLRLELQNCLGLGDCFGEGEPIHAVPLLDLLPEEGTPVPPEQARLAARAAVLAGQCLEVAERLNAEEGAATTKSFAQVLLSDLIASPFASEAK